MHLLFFSQKDTPGPNSYDVPRAYQALTVQHRQPPRSKNARQRQSQFLSTAKRTFAGETIIDTPGPAAYDGFLTSRSHGYAPVNDARFHNETTKMPGPADYEVRTEEINNKIIFFYLKLSPLLQDTVLRGTFNSTLNNPILVKLQNRAIREEKVAAHAADSSAPIVDGSTGNRE